MSLTILTILDNFIASVTSIVRLHSAYMPHDRTLQTVDLAVDRRCLVATVVFGVDFHDARVTAEDLVEVLWRLVAVENATECVASTHRFGFIS